MKRTQIKTIVASAFLAIFSGGCKKILDEQPRATFTPDYFQTSQGVQGGVTSLYAHLRTIYGQGYYYNTCETGTDEATYAQSADENFKVMDISGQGNITSSNSRADVIWGSSYSDINTASGIIENGGKLGVSNALLAEAKFFRGFDYFLLVQTFGGVALDLGSGELKFNTSAVRTSKRNTVPEVYTKAIFPDLTAAVNDLPDAPRVVGGVTKTVARLFLAKAYLTYGWWLENPNNIPTYPAVANRTDPAGKNPQYYYQQAYNLAVAGITNAGTNYALQPTYYDVNLATNDRNKEIMLWADHTENSTYTGGNIYDGNGPNSLNQDNYAVWMMTFNYTNIRSSSSPTTWSAVSSVQREAEQHLGRPYIRMCPTIGVVKNTFADKTNDSRYDGTFTTVYRGNWQKGSAPVSTYSTLYNSNFLPVTPGSAILTFLNDEPVPPITYPSGAGNSNVGAGTLPGRADWVVSPNGISRLVYPGLWKLGTYRTDNGTGLGYPNAGLTRPFNIAKFSELFFIAAEAAVKGATTTAVTGTYANDGTARGLINIIRARAGKWRFDNNGNVAKIQDNSAAMIAATPATVDIDYILAERSREYFGEGYRWYDLIRTQRWTAFASTYQICGSTAGDHTPVTVSRSIDSHHYLRPIPQGQIDAMQASADEKAAYQNPGY
ncbi:RagB/SusD family nutrient uptake outer membrane protein [Flavisolibacter ginsenosidimutans]|uniref:RagB/SusD family nutrient uptake outer membrane protein n=1 Tax=Flavisolibacter ginsenosidimutans TaxID=661481 RepID=A0A5B8UIW7_9BACT|nr:RagB/SusD family nutrient uptake outer membrane protein [Flavisolibacter ginsenosidimutans]QEC56336.1 RagB/SusD family nutrient uptake outer membrane protein [Flavisolibacter ginsenosidimutans]